MQTRILTSMDLNLEPNNADELVADNRNNDLREEYNNELENEVGHFEAQPENEEIDNDDIAMEDIAAIEEQVPDHNTEENVGNPQQMFEDANEVEHGINNNINIAMDNKYGEQTSEYNLRHHKPRDYSHLHATLEHTALTQYGLK
jgi:hypothetical protein